MSECDDCELRGYSRELCLIHLRHCRKLPERRPAPASLRLGARTAGGMALGATAGLLLSTAASFVGGPAVFYALMVKLVAAGGLIGGSWALVHGVGALRAQPAPAPPRRAPRARARGYQPSSRIS